MEELNLGSEKGQTLIAVAVLSGFGLLMAIGALAGVAAYVYL
ncbi:hypothetical protein RJD24_21285 [Bacillaceae bacterium IKA-2]|nr:hypothetical protein RJD24_21285 [Bacillaceae bacterium IKA-2]